MIRNVETVEPQTVERPPEAGPTSNLYRIAWQRKALIILGLVIALVIGAFYYTQRQPLYQSFAQVLIIPKVGRPMFQNNSDIGSLMDDYVATHQVLIRSPYLIRQAVEKQNLRELCPGTLGSGDAVGTIINGLNVLRSDKDSVGSGRSSILNLTFRGPVSSECGVILDGVIAAFRNFLTDKYDKGSDEALHLITQAKEGLNKIMYQQSKELREFLTDPKNLQWNYKDSVNPGLLLLQAIQAKRTELRGRRTEIESKLKMIELALKTDRGAEAQQVLAMDRRNSNPDIDRRSLLEDVRAKLMEAEFQKQQVAKEYGLNHPKVQAIEATIEYYNKVLQLRTKESEKDSARTEATKDKSVTDPIGLTKGSLLLELERIRFEEIDLGTQYDAQMQEASKIQAVAARLNELEGNVKMSRDLVDSIAKRLQEMGVSKGFGGYDVQAITEPTGGGQVEPKPFTIFTLASILGLLGGLGLAYLAEITDKSFRSPDEIRRRLNVPVVGHIPTLLTETDDRARADAGVGLDPILCTYYKPKSRKAEVFRGVRTALYFSTHGEGHKVIQITSPNMGDGKTTLSTNLAVSIAQSGKRILLIDADFRRPRIHKIFNLTNDAGFASVILGQCELRDAIQPTVIPGLSIMTSGPIPPNPAELLTSPRVKELLDEMRQQFDFILLDTPPLLVVTDPCVVAPRVDGVLLTIRVAKNGRPVAERAKEVLTTLGANVLGVVVNGINLFGAQGSYGYGYSYGYQYGQYDYSSAYQYRYEYTDRYYAAYTDDGYYQDPESQAGAAQQQVNGSGPANGASPPSTGTEPAKKGLFNRLFGKKK